MTVFTQVARVELPVVDIVTYLSFYAAIHTCADIECFKLDIDPVSYRSDLGMKTVQGMVLKRYI